jgi:hypothetical protein
VKLHTFGGLCIESNDCHIELCASIRSQLSMMALPTLIEMHSYFIRYTYQTSKAYSRISLTDQACGNLMHVSSACAQTYNTKRRHRTHQVLMCHRTSPRRLTAGNSKLPGYPAAVGELRYTEALQPLVLTVAEK